MSTQAHPPSESPARTRTPRTILERCLQRARKVVITQPVLPIEIQPQPRQPGQPVPLSYAQERLWFLDQLNPCQPVYNVYQAVRITGWLDQAVLDRSFNEIIQRHEILRTNFAIHEGQPMQIVAAERRLKTSVIDLRSLRRSARESKMQERLMEEIRHPFDLARDPLLRPFLVRMGPDEHVLLITIHHIIADGWSLRNLFHELATLYNAFASGLPSPLPTLPIQYADFALWERSDATRSKLEKSLAYWREQLSGNTEALDLPTDYPRPVESFARGATRSIHLPSRLARDLKALSKREGATLFMTLLAGFQTLLHRYSGQESITVGSGIAGRSLLELEPLIGFFVNTLVFQGDLTGNPTVTELLARTREAGFGAFEHQNYPFEKLVHELQPERSPGRNPFFQVMITMQTLDDSSPQPHGLAMHPIELENGTAKFDLTLAITESKQGIHAAIEFRTDLFEPATVERMLGHYQVTLQAMTEDPTRRISELPILTSAEKQQLLVDWNDTSRDFPRHETVHHLVEAQARRTPNATALVCGGQSVTYGELNRRANQLARRLVRLGVGPETLVAICLERSVEMIVALLGILKSGGAYVSLDPTCPAERLSFMLADTRAPVLLTVEELSHLFSSAKEETTPYETPNPTVLRLDTDRPEIEREETSDPACGAKADTLAYVSYTSGSTGRPKGVCITHRSIIRLLVNTDYVRLKPSDVVAQISNCSFDASTFEIWGALLSGARLVILPPDQILSPHQFAKALVENEVTTLMVTTALFNRLAQTVPGIFKPLRQLLFGGESSHPASVRAVLNGGPPDRLLHVYGPTETTTYATYLEVHQVPDGAATIPIGRPIANTTVYVLDSQKQPVPIGVPGELYIGGDGLARGYLRRPDLDSTRFLPNPFSSTPGDRLYRTGDRVRWRPDGTIEFLGRFDQQVKIRGHRVEPAEIEAALEAHPDIEQAVVLTHDFMDERRLAAYVTTVREPAPSPAELREFLLQKLPAYMMPVSFTFVPSIPLNANGKVDRSALPQPAFDSPIRNTDTVETLTETEQRLISLWRKVLGIHRIGREDNFFEMGGHSLSGVRLFSLIEKEFSRRLPLGLLFQFPTVKQLAQKINESVGTSTGSTLVPLQPRGNRPPIFFVHGAGGGNLWTYANLVPHLGFDQPVYALESRAIHGLEEFTQIEEMAANYLEQIRSTQPHGPYYLGGYCFGGNVAYEIARQLEAQGEKIALLALLDSTASTVNYNRIPWWNPLFFYRFAKNTSYWLQDFLDQDPVERRRFVQRKSQALRRRISRLFERSENQPAEIDLEAFIDVSLYPPNELQIWRSHLNALRNYRPKPYPGKVTLFRTRGQPFFCSFDPHLGWGTLAEGGVEVVHLHGAHEMIFKRPHVFLLSALLRAQLSRAHALISKPSSVSQAS